MRDLIYKLFLMDKEIQQKKDNLNSAKEKKESAKKLFANLNIEIQELKKDLSNKEKLLKSLNLDLDDNLSKQKKDKNRLDSGIIQDVKVSAKLQLEINNLIKKQEEIEEKILILMEEIEEKKKIIPQKENELKNADNDFLQKEKLYNEELQNFNNYYEQAKVERESLMKQIDEDLIETYNSLTKRQKTAISLVENNECQECLVDVPKEKLAKLKELEEIIYCDSCDRILYQLPDTIKNN